MVKNVSMQAFGARPRKTSKDEFKQMLQELDKAHEELSRIEDVFLERKGVHVAAGEAVMWISVTRAKLVQLFEEQHPYVSRAEYYEITGKDRRF